MKILWLSNKVQSAEDRGTTGTWLDAMAQALLQSGEVELGNIAQGNVLHPTRRDCGSIRQWIVPSHAVGRNGLPPHSIVQDIVQIVEDFSPDLVHIWGTEGYWGLLTARKHLRVPALLEMQGIKGAIARVYGGGLSLYEQLQCVGLKEVVRGTTFLQRQRQFEKWGKIEREIINGHRFITAQSQWSYAQIRVINPASIIFHNDCVLREPFYTASVWQYQALPTIFCSAAYSAPFKGLHVALRAIAVLKPRFPTISLRIAGAHQQKGLRQDGYVRWLNNQAAKMGISDNMSWLGALSAQKIVSEMHNCSVMLHPSYIENVSLSLAEGMMLGVPSVNSYVGGSSSLARDEESALFFSPGDVEMCAHQLGRLLTDRLLAERISKKAREIALTRNDRGRIVYNQLEIYRQVLTQAKTEN